MRGSQFLFKFPVNTKFINKTSTKGFDFGILDIVFGLVII